jgi:Fe2+ transport system protein B
MRKTTTLLNLIMITFLTLLTTGCDFDPFNQKAKNAANQEQMKNSQEISKLKLQASNEQVLARISNENNQVQLQQEKELEKLRLEVALQEKKLELTQKDSESKLQHTALLNEQNLDLELQKYIFGLLTLIIVIASIFAFIYFKHRREDKLRAYNDNLEKYFEHQQSQTRAQIAQKLLDTIASGHLDRDQEQRLISVFNGEKIDELPENKSPEAEIEEAQVIEPTKA